METIQNAPVSPPSNVLGSSFTSPGLLRFALPTVAMMLFMGLYTLVDTIFVSRFVHTDALSALNICTPVLYAVVGLSSMLATGANAIVGRKMGEMDARGARETFSFIVLLTACLSLLLTAAGLCFQREILRALGASERLLPHCIPYLRIQLLFLPANMLGSLFQHFFVTAGKPSLGLRLALATGILNIVLDALFILPMNLGIAGASLGTACGYVVTMAAGLVFFARSRGPLHFVRPRFRMGELLQSCSNGSSEMVSQLSSAVTTFFFNRTMMRLAGESGVAAITVIIYSQFLLTTIFLGFSMGVAPIFSYQYGSGDRRRLRNTLRSCLRLVAAASLGVWALSLACGAGVAGLFSPPGTAVYALTREGFRIFPHCFLFCGCNVFTSAFFTALSNGKASAGLSFLRTFVLIVAALLILPAAWGTTGVWLALPLAEGCAFVVALCLLAAYRPRYGYGGK